MKYYQELTIIPSFEVPLYFIWSKVYQQLHLGFVEVQDENGIVPFGVSFPQYQYDDGLGRIGEKMRVFANSESALNELRIKKWVLRLTDYVHITGIREVPEKKVGYAIYRRVHTENSAAQKATRFLKRHQEIANDYQQVVKMFSRKRSACDLPYIQQKSLTNNNSFRLYIGKSYSENDVNDGFGTYGLSNTSTVPEF